MTEDKTYADIHAWIDLWLPTQSEFTAQDVDRELNLSSRTAKQYRWRILEQKVKDGILAKMGKNYHVIDKNVDVIDWQNADVTNVIPLRWPFELEKYIKVFPKSVCILAGVSGSGKTAFLYEFILRNMRHDMPITLFSNDMGAEEMKERFDNFKVTIPNPAPWRTVTRYDNFSEVIDPDGINIIDLLDMDSEYYLIGREIFLIDKAIRTGMALIAIQKGATKTYGQGGDQSRKRAKLYLTMDYNGNAEDNEPKGLLKIDKSRGRADSSVNPKGMVIDYKLVNGYKFIFTRR